MKQTDFAELKAVNPTRPKQALVVRSSRPRFLHFSYLLQCSHARDVNASLTCCQPLQQQRQQKDCATASTAGATGKQSTSPSYRVLCVYMCLEHARGAQCHFPNPMYKLDFWPARVLWRTKQTAECALPGPVNSKLQQSTSSAALQIAVRRSVDRATAAAAAAAVLAVKLPKTFSSNRRCQRRRLARGMY